MELLETRSYSAIYYQDAGYERDWQQCRTKIKKVEERVSTIMDKREEVERHVSFTKS